jgi:hypothetical protein
MIPEDAGGLAKIELISERLAVLKDKYLALKDDTDTQKR